MCKFPSDLFKRIFWSAACSTHPRSFNRAMKQLIKSFKGAHEQLNKLDPKYWSKVFFKEFSKADKVENNMSNCFDTWIFTKR